MNEDYTSLRKTVETILCCDLVKTIGIDDKAEAEGLIERFLHAIADRTDEDVLARWIDPQWVILAGGKGTRIDPSSRLNKNLDVWFGEQNTLQLSRRYLPGSRPHIIVINPQMAARITKTKTGVVIPESALDPAVVERLFGANVILCVQPQPDGTGGALRAALPAIAEADAEFIGVAFGDEPFLNQSIFLQTLISHFIAGADITLCGKLPETVVDKGGLFFDRDGAFIGTKEWYDMNDAKKEEMWRRLERGEAYTNTGITLIRRDAAVTRMDRLQPHGSQSELHHVDLIRYCYEDGLKTHAYIYEGEILSGLNRWANVLIGEEYLCAQVRQQLALKDVRVDPAAQITPASEKISIGHGSYLLGRVHLGKGVRIGNYCRLENVTLMSNTTVGDLISLKDVVATDTEFESNPLWTEVAAPICSWATHSQIADSRFDRVKVGHSVSLASVSATATVIPSGISVSDVQLGISTDTALGLPRFPSVKEGKSPLPLAEGSTALDQLALPGYKPGVFTFTEKRDMPDWENLCQHVKSHSQSELIRRATLNPALRQVAIDAVKALLEKRKSDSTYVIDDLTPEELWGNIFEIVALCTGNPDPYCRDKRRSRQTAAKLLTEFSNAELLRSEGIESEREWLERLKLVIAANIIDYSSAWVVAKLDENPDYFAHVLREAIHAPLSIDCFHRFHTMVVTGEPKRLIWLIDNDGEAVFDLWLIQMLAGRGHQITVAAKAAPTSNDVTFDDLREISGHLLFRPLQEKIATGDVSIISSGSRTIGTNLHQATPEFANALLDADVVISKGQGNFYTTQGLKKAAFYLLLSKGLTAERATGVAADRNKVVDGLILAYVPGGTRLDRPLKEFCASMA